MRSDELFGGTTGSGYDKPFGVERGSGYEPKTIATQSPLSCPKCGKPCAGTAERKTCASCGFSGIPRVTGERMRPGTTLEAAIAATANPCPQCGACLTILGERKRCNSCNFDNLHD